MIKEMLMNLLCETENFINTLFGSEYSSQSLDCVLKYRKPWFICGLSFFNKLLGVACLSLKGLLELCFNPFTSLMKSFALDMNSLWSAVCWLSRFLMPFSIHIRTISIVILSLVYKISTRSRSDYVVGVSVLCEVLEVTIVKIWSTLVCRLRNSFLDTAIFFFFFFLGFEVEC